MKTDGRKNKYQEDLEREIEEGGWDSVTFEAGAYWAKARESTRYKRITEQQANAFNYYLNGSYKKMVEVLKHYHSMSGPNGKASKLLRELGEIK